VAGLALGLLAGIFSTPGPFLQEAVEKLEARRFRGRFLSGESYAVRILSHIRLDLGRLRHE